MKRYRNLLVGIDLTLEGDAVSPGSRRAALQAQWLAERTGASLTLLHSTWADLYEDGGSIRHGTSAEGLQALEDFAQEYAAAGSAAELITVKERPWLEIIRRVIAGQHDFVFVARRNEPGVKVLGSTSKKLLRKCPAPVWVVKPDSELVHETILAATDLTAVGDRAVELGAAIAQAYECELHVVHAWQVPFEAQFESEQKSRDHLEEIQRAAEKHVREALHAVVPAVEPHLHIGCDAPSRAILKGVERLSPELLVMGTVSRGGVAGLLMGNTAERLLDKVECSLLAIKPEDFVSPVTPG